MNQTKKQSDTVLPTKHGMEQLRSKKLERNDFALVTLEPNTPQVFKV
jgi:hypothetical protein